MNGLPAPTASLALVETTTVNGMALGPRTVLSLGGSPATIQNITSTRLIVLVSLGSISLIEFSRNGESFDNVGALAGQFILSIGDWLRLTYLLAPTVVAYPI